MYFVAGVTGGVAGFALWIFTSHWIASFIIWAEGRYPQLIGSRSLRASEIIACGLQVLAAFGLAFWIARLMIV